ncbi:MAG: peptidoglycan-binding protein [Myxococcota bacterium]
MPKTERPKIHPALATPASNQPGDDIERHFFANCGPHEAWNEPEPEPETDTDEDLAEALESADEDVRKLHGSTASTPTECSNKHLTALEATLTDEKGPLAGLTVLLHRAEPPGVIEAKTDDVGFVRFAGLDEGDKHQLQIRGVPPSAWSIGKKAALPDDRAECSHAAKWSLSKSKRPKTHVAQQGESIWSIAQYYGIDADELWKANEALEKDDRSMHVLFPDDEITLPEDDDDDRQDVPVGKELQIECDVELPRLQFVFKDQEGKALETEAVVVSGGASAAELQPWFEGNLDGSGKIEVPMPKYDERASMLVAFDLKFPETSTTYEDVDGLEMEHVHQPSSAQLLFKPGHLDPLSTVSGVQGRLANLGYYSGDERGELGPLTKRALRDFRHDHELEPMATIDDEMRSSLDAESK